MAVVVTETALPGVLILEPRVFPDPRGWFFESFNARDFGEATGLTRTFVQDNHSRSTRGVLRGLHYQLRAPQGKLVRVAVGEVFDVAVDLRRSSPTFGRWTGACLSAENRRQLWIPEGFAHGFVVLSEVAELLYKTTDYWNASDERVLAWSDADVGIEWPTESFSGGEPLLSARDAQGTPLAVADSYA